MQSINVWLRTLVLLLSLPLPPLSADIFCPSAPHSINHTHSQAVWSAMVNFAVQNRDDERLLTDELRRHNLPSVKVTGHVGTCAVGTHMWGPEIRFVSALLGGCVLPLA